MPLLAIKFNLDHISRAITFSEISASAIGAIPKFSRRKIRKSIDVIRKGFPLELGDHWCFHHSDFDVVAADYFDFPVVDVILL